VSTFSFLVPTHREDRPLARCLNSIAPQLGPLDEVIVIGDTHDGPLGKVESLVGSYDHRFRYVAYDAGEHDYGHSQLNHGMALATCDYIHCNDDDDVWTPEALRYFRAYTNQFPEPRPFLFRFQSYLGPVFWVHPGWFARNYIGGHCLLAPNVPDKLGAWGTDYSGDFDYVEATVNAYGGSSEAVWCEEIVALARPA